MQVPAFVPLESRYIVVVPEPVADNSVEGVDVPPAPILPCVANCPEEAVVVAVPFTSTLPLTFNVLEADTGPAMLRFAAIEDDATEIYPAVNVERPVTVRVPVAVTFATFDKLPEIHMFPCTPSILETTGVELAIPTAPVKVDAPVTASVPVAVILETFTKAPEI